MPVSAPTVKPARRPMRFMRSEAGRVESAPPITHAVTGSVAIEESGGDKGDPANGSTKKTRGKHKKDKGEAKKKRPYDQSRGGFEGRLRGQGQGHDVRDDEALHQAPQKTAAPRDFPGTRT